MGRPLQPPTIKPLYRPDGTVRGYLVSATVGGKQRKKIRRTMDQAKDLAAKWQGCRDESIQHLPTTLTIPKLRDAEAADAFWESLGLTATEAAAWMVQHYKKPADGTWNVLIEEFRQARRVKHRLKEDAPDTPHLVNLFAAARGFAAHTGRPNVGNPTQDEVESFMKTRGGFNQLLGDLRSLCIWAVKRGRMPVDPTLAIERQMRVRGKIPTILRPEQVAHILHTLEAEAPEWIPYAAVCIFAYVRPYTREGEAQRMDADLREGRQVVLKDGLFVSLSKNGNPPCRGDDFVHRESLAVAQVVGTIAVLQGTQCAYMGVNQIGDMDVVTNTGSVRSRVVIAEDRDVCSLAQCHLQYQRDEMQFWRVMFTTFGGGPGGIEISKAGVP